uniref:VP4 n=1 Tax=Fennes virus TaxID=2707218 RepID=A0A6H0DH62_9VIRU|nr:MAG: VP4 [Fennes virus]
MGSNVSTQINNYTVVGSSNNMEALAIDKTDQHARLDAQIAPTTGLNPATATFDTLSDWRSFMDLRVYGDDEDNYDFFARTGEWAGKISGAIKMVGAHMDKLAKIGSVIHETYAQPLQTVDNDEQVTGDIEAFSDGYSSIMEGTYLNDSYTTTGGRPRDVSSSSDPFSTYYGDFDSSDTSFDGWYSGAQAATKRFLSKASNVGKRVVARAGGAMSDRLGAGAISAPAEKVKHAFANGARAVVGAIKRGVEADADVHGGVVSTRTVSAVPPNDHIQKIAQNIPPRAVSGAMDRVSESGKDIGIAMVPKHSSAAPPVKVVGSTSLQEVVDKTPTAHGSVRDVRTKVGRIIRKMEQFDSDLLVLTPEEIPIGMFPVDTEEENLSMVDVFEALPIRAEALSGLTVRESGAIHGKFSSTLDATVKSMGAESNVAVKVVGGRAHSYRIMDLFWGPGETSDHDVHFSLELTTVMLFTSHSDPTDYGCGVLIGHRASSGGVTQGLIFPAFSGKQGTKMRVHGVVTWRLSLDVTSFRRNGLGEISSTKWDGTFVPVLYCKQDGISKISTCELGMRVSQVVVAPLLVKNYFIYDGARCRDKTIFHVVCRIRPDTTITSSNRDLVAMWERMCDVFDGVLGQMGALFRENERLTIIPTRFRCLLQSLGIESKGVPITTDQQAGNWLAEAALSIRRWPFIWATNPFFSLREQRKHLDAERLAACVVLVLLKVLPMTAFSTVNTRHRESVGQAVKTIQNWEVQHVRNQIGP